MQFVILLIHVLFCVLCGLQIGILIGGEHARQAVSDLERGLTSLPGNDYSVPLIAVLLSLADKEVVQAVVKSPSLLARLVQYTSRNMKSRSVSVILLVLVCSLVPISLSAYICQLMYLSITVFYVLQVENVPSHSAPYILLIAHHVCSSTSLLSAGCSQRITMHRNSTNMQDI